MLIVLLDWKVLPLIVKVKDHMSVYPTEED
ncbi:hypothetical protein Godav_006352 [Gossypium davidsonii]|uniref:Uncharacterized protein n=1 Tax=Gossypium davidsonii TaxID=34287 RepID=A0A7J8S3K9_GOSDV|nr:hypothetical protein [Gossypium davidsonii]